MATLLLEGKRQIYMYRLELKYVLAMIACFALVWTANTEWITFRVVCSAIWLVLPKISAAIVDRNSTKYYQAPFLIFHMGPGNEATLGATICIPRRVQLTHVGCN